MTPQKHLLPFDSIVTMIEEGFAQLPPWISFHFSVEQYVWHLLEWLSVKIEDGLATSASDSAISYLKKHNVEEQFAQEMSHFIMDQILYTVTAAFPNITYLELSRSRYVMEDRYTLAVYIPPCAN